MKEAQQGVQDTAQPSPAPPVPRSKLTEQFETHPGHSEDKQALAWQPALRYPQHNQPTPSHTGSPLLPERPLKSFVQYLCGCLKAWHRSSVPIPSSPSLPTPQTQRWAPFVWLQFM